MKRLAVLLVALVFVAIAAGALSLAGDTDTVPQVDLCHKDAVEISVGQEAVAAHLAHGDTIGPCICD